MLGAERDRFRCKFFEKLLYAGLCPWPKDANDVEFCMPRGARLARAMPAGRRVRMGVLAGSWCRVGYC